MTEENILRAAFATTATQDPGRMTTDAQEPAGAPDPGPRPGRRPELPPPPLRRSRTPHAVAARSTGWRAAAFSSRSGRDIPGPVGDQPDVPALQQPSGTSSTSSPAILTVAAAGTLVLICGGLDLSVGAIYALAGTMATQLTQTQGPVVGIGGRAASWRPPSRRSNRERHHRHAGSGSTR